jgi:hypothetical protein
MDPHMTPKTHHGHCECGAVAFTVTGARLAITMCHCAQCRRLSGHHWAATHASWTDVSFRNQVGLTWYKSSAWAKRGFCNRCGASLFYRMNDDDGVGIAAGCIDAPTGFTAGKHIFTRDKGDYYDIAGDAPHIEKF